MSNISNQSQNLYSIDGVQDLSHESAAAVSGGADVTLYSGRDFKGAVREINDGQKKLGGFDNITSSVKVDGKINKKVWRFYKDPDFKGASFDVGPGQSLSHLPAGFNNKISSLRSIG
jgi:Beta/Gamma crystallin